MKALGLKAGNQMWGRIKVDWIQKKVGNKVKAALIMLGNTEVCHSNLVYATPKGDLVMIIQLYANMTSHSFP
jgi:hypothetical protein